VGYRVNEPFPDGELTGEVRVCSLDELVAEPATRVVVRQPRIGAEEFISVVESVGLHGVNYVVGYTAWLDLAPDGVSKASALEAIRLRCGVAAKDTLAIGDGRNDLEMLAWAGARRRHGSGPRVVQDAADDVTATSPRTARRWSSTGGSPRRPDPAALPGCDPITQREPADQPQRQRHRHHWRSRSGRASADDAWSKGGCWHNPSLVEGFELHNSPVARGTERTATMER
jgi:hypothetical protein